MAKKNLFYILIGAIIILVLGFIAGNKFCRISAASSKLEFQKGMTYASWTKHGYGNVSSIKSMGDMASLGVKWVALLTTWYQDKAGSTEIYPLDEKTPSDQDLIFSIQKLHESGIKIMLKPHLDVIASDGRWRGDIEFAGPDDWKRWFESYGEFILHYARLAQKEKVELLCIGTELSNTTLNQPDLWRDLISKVRKVYKGRLTYAANWYEEFEGIRFWNDLDYAGVDVYFPLSASLSPTKSELKDAWKNLLEKIRYWQAYINKPVIFAEIGYKSSQGSAEEPWRHDPTGSVDLQLQADCYEALLETFWDEPWFYGVYWWYWSYDSSIGGETNRGFIIQDKPAEKVVEQWYSKPVPQKN